MMWRGKMSLLEKQITSTKPSRPSALSLFQKIVLICLGVGTFMFLIGAYADEPVYIVCIDPGHQLHADYSQEPIGPGATQTKACVSSGTSGPISGPEHAVNLDVGLRLHDILTSNGVIVIMTRVRAEVHLCNSQRAIIANKAKADLFIRLHCNAGTAHSCFTLYPAKIEGWTDDIYEESKRAAEIVQSEYSAYTGIPSAGIIPRSDITGFNWADVPAILPEMLHMQNPDDDRLASTPEFRQKMAEGLAKGILKYLRTRTPKKSSLIFR
ncbi:N-acetylmuramoyl-L-alanine amidase [Candidatus Sumerlaeota bacterium]|nr:N-acetylmuramoyl-L-alanine amidase [Candidatus Sumerlaeota bacterium]